MRLRNIKGARQAVEDSALCISDPRALKGKWKEYFKGTNELALEIGCGKGRFIRQMAENKPDTAFIGIERYSSVLYKAIKRTEGEELPNLRFICEDARLLAEFFAGGELGRIYLNFSDPWPKERHAGRRLTGADFLRMYAALLNESGSIEFKTDNRALFDWSLEQLPGSRFELYAVTYDLHTDERLMKENCMTEYEEKFSAKGNKICKAVLVKRTDK